MSWNNAHGRKIISLNQRMTFGKFKGYTIEYILDNHPEYIEWLVDEDVCEVSTEIYNAAQEHRMDDYVNVDGVYAEFDDVKIQRMPYTPVEE